MLSSMDNKFCIKDKYINISVIHIVAACLIVFCHIFQSAHQQIYSMIGQFLIVGNSLFFLVAGVLAYKEKYDWKRWYLNKFFRILLPMYLFEIIVIISKCIYFGGIAELTIKHIFVLIFNFQGFVYVADEFGHLWFVTALMIIYLTVPILNKIRKFKALFLPILAIIQILLLFINTRIATYCSYYILFCIGYFFRDYFICKVKFNISRVTIILSIATVIMIALRLFAKVIMDESLFYQGVVVLYQQHITAVAIYFVISLIVKNTMFLRFEKVYRLILNCERYTYYLYLVHPIFVNGFLRFTGNNFGVKILYVIIMSLISCVVLGRLSDFIIRKIRGI